MAQNQGQGGQGGQTGQGPKQSYVVTTDFVDEKGRSWTVGTAFQGEEGAIRKALAAGQIAEAPKPTPQ